MSLLDRLDRIPLSDLGAQHRHRDVQRLGRIGSITAPAIIGFFAAALDFAGVFTMTTAVLLVGVAVVLMFGLSTAGQSLEELSERRGLDAAASPDVP
jgi:hypothetical protein